MSEKQRVIIDGSADCRDEIAAVSSAVAANGIFAERFDVIDAERSTDTLVDGGFRPDDVLVLLLGNHYGSATCEGLSLTESLFNFAGDAGVKRLVFTKATGRMSERQRAFIERISCLLVRRNFLTADDAVKAVFASLGGILIDQDKDKFHFAETVEPIQPSVEAASLPAQWLLSLILPSTLSGICLPPPNVFKQAKFERENAQRLLAAARQAQDDFHRQVDPNDLGKTFDLKVEIEDLDMARLSEMIAPEKRHLEKLGLKEMSVMDYLILHNYASKEGRLYDIAQIMFGKTAFPSNAPTKAPKSRRKNLKLGVEAIRFAAELWENHRFDTESIPVKKGRRISKKDVFCHFQKQLKDRGVESVESFRLAINNAQHQELFSDIFKKKPRRRLPLKK